MACDIHRNREARETIDDRIRNLPEFQGGLGRHVCVYCSYEQGYQDALDDLQAKLEELKNP